MRSRVGPAVALLTAAIVCTAAGATVDLPCSLPPEGGSHESGGSHEVPGQGTAAGPTVPAASKDIEVTFTNGPVTLAGTLTLPAREGPSPAVVLLTGSGPQNRDEELFGFRPFKIIAEHLSEHGIAVLRYDDRGIGGSSGSVITSTTEDFAGDALAAVAMLAERKEIQGRQIGLLGHSEGALAAGIAASRSDRVAFIVLLAGTTLLGDENLRGQLIDLTRAAGVEPALVAKIAAAHRRATDLIRASAPDEEIVAAFKALARLQIDAAPEAERKMITDPDAFVDKALGEHKQFLLSAWMRYFVSFDPAVPLARVSCPILAVFGGKDLQVPVATNRPPLEAAVARSGNRDVTIKVYTDANHLFIPAVTGSPLEYGTLEKRFVPGLLDGITAWIHERTRPEKGASPQPRSDAEHERASRREHVPVGQARRGLHEAH